MNLQCTGALNLDADEKKTAQETQGKYVLNILYFYFYSFFYVIFNYKLSV